MKLPDIAALFLEKSPEKIIGCVEGREQTVKQQRHVDIVRKNDQLVIDVVSTQELNQSHGVRKRNVAVVVCVNEKNGRFPFADLGNRRRSVGNTVRVD